MTNLNTLKEICVKSASRLIFSVIALYFIQSAFIYVQAQETTRSPGSFDFNDNGIVFMTADSTKSVIMRFRMQNQLTMNSVSENDLSTASSDWSIRRLRLRFGGFLYDPRLTFNLQLSFARRDWDFEDSDVPNIIRDAMVFWNFTPNIQIGMGQTKLPGNRQRVISSGDLQFSDRTIVNSKFTLDRDFGIQGLYSASINDLILNLRGAVSTGDGRYAPQLQGANFAYTGRVEALPFGKFTNGGDYFEGDILREQTPKLSVGASYSHNEKSTRTRGQLGEHLYEPRTMKVFIADAVFKYCGFALYGEYAQRDADNPVTFDNNGNSDYVFKGRGWVLQASYYFPFKLETAARIATVEPHEDIYGLSGADWNRHITGCVTYYIARHRAKAQIEITHNTLENMKTNISKTNWITRFNVELGI